MNRRRQGRKPTVALWMLVALADVAIIVASAGLLTLLLVVAALAVIVAGGIYAVRSFRRGEPEPVRAVVRRRA